MRCSALGPADGGHGHFGTLTRVSGPGMTATWHNPPTKQDLAQMVAVFTVYEGVYVIYLFT